MIPDDYREVARAYLRDSAMVIGGLAAVVLIYDGLLMLFGFDEFVLWIVAVPFVLLVLGRLALCASAVSFLWARARELERAGGDL